MAESISYFDTVARQYFERHDMEFIRSEDGGWVRYYRDRDSGEIWKLSYPQSHLHGDGPALLELVVGETDAPGKGQ